MNKKLLIGILGIILLTGIITTGFIIFTDGADVVPAKELVKVSTRLSWFINSLHSGFLAADDLGYYEKAGLDVTNNPGGPDFPAINLVVSGSDDFGLISGIDPLLIARSKGVPVKAIAVLHQVDPNVFMSLKDSGITKPSDFVGKKIGVWYGHPTESYYKSIMKKLGIDISKVTEVPIKMDISPLLSGQVDIMPGFVSNHLLLINEKGYEANVIEPSDYGIDSYGFTIFTTDEMIEEHPDIVQKYLDSTLRGYEWALEYPKEATDIAVKYNPSLKDSYVHQLNQLIADIEHFLPQEDSEIGCMDAEIWKESYDRLAGQNLIENKFDYRETFTTQFLKC